MAAELPAESVALTPATTLSKPHPQIKKHFHMNRRKNQAEPSAPKIGQAKLD